MYLQRSGGEGCGGDDDDNNNKANVGGESSVSIMTVADLGTPMTTEEQSAVMVRDNMTIGGTTYTGLTCTPILKTGFKDTNGEVFGLIKDVDGDPIVAEDGNYFLCRNIMSAGFLRRVGFIRDSIMSSCRCSMCGGWGRSFPGTSQEVRKT